ncbi:GNAT family N-acetyltransferase [Sneathiella aquimaris]|uniref:GNAT family N-acetyltransferase n=1 Tax=Sneathiella aquimaris TaxID=2599305 RepID=UPI00146B8458|nr:GNAT family N-acetyltransferase [Sneathiella aquimaris]
MQIECFKSLDGPLQIEWEGFLENSKNQHPRQLPVFANIEKAEGNACYFLIGRKENTISAVALASLVPSRIFKNKFSQANILSGPIINNEDDFYSFINNLKKQTIFKNVGRLNVSPYWLEEDALIAHRVLKDAGFSSAEPQPFRKTGIVDLTRSEDEIFSAFSKSARRETRRAERQEITVQPITDKSTYLEFLALLNNLRKNRHLSELDSQSMAFSFENFYKKGENGIVLCALHEKTVIAGLQIYRSNVTAHGRHFAGDTEKLKELKNLRISPLLWLEGMKWAKKSGCHRFDLEGYDSTVTSDNSHYYIYKYKGEFSPAEVKRVSEHYTVTNRALHFPGHLKTRAKEIIKRILRR